MSEDDLPFLERTMLRHWVLQWLKLVSWYYTVLASDYVTIEEALSGPVVATDWRAQKDVNSALLNGRDGVMFCTGTLTSIVSGYTLVQQAGVTQPTAVLFRSFNVATSEKDPSLSWLEKMEDVEVELLSRVPQALEKQKSSASLRGWGNKEACGRGGEGGATSPLPLLFPDYPSLPSPSAGPKVRKRKKLCSVNEIHSRTKEIVLSPSTISPVSTSAISPAPSQEADSPVDYSIVFQDSCPTLPPGSTGTGTAGCRTL
ncbi:hypothetical protein L1987_88785 [Smallanthus sonchifolius]|nr:hypothetical protein L1987_88785 [Smallanthus sonchifolius]